MSCAPIHCLVERQFELFLSYRSHKKWASLWAVGATERLVMGYE